MDEKQRERFGETVEDKKRAARLESEQEGLEEHGRPQDVPDPRTKNAGHGKKTADKWNQ